MNAFAPEECNFITNSKFQLSPGLTEDGKNTEVRKSKIYWIPKNQEWAELYQKIMNLVGHCNKEFYNFDISSLTENLQFTEYDESYQGHYDWHFDVGEGALNCGRKLSVVVQLTDPSKYEGGELQFSMDGDKILVAEKEQGTVIIFPSYMRHRVTPVTKGRRHSLVTWITGPPFR
jgi:PKHD-type hydroxylase